MAVTVEVMSLDGVEKARREAAACRVLEHFGEGLPKSNLLAFFDDHDWAQIKSPPPRGIGPENRGFYTPIKKGTFRGNWNWPQCITNRIFGNDCWAPDDERFFDHVIYLHGTTCGDATSLVMTFSHELQHFIQYGFSRDLWAVGRLICLISGTGLSWPDVPHEREARIVAKRVATEICGLDAVKQYIERKIREGSTTDAEDWRFSLQLDPSISYDLEGETKRIFKRLRPYRGALESVLKEERRDPDYKDIDLSRYFDAT